MASSNINYSMDSHWMAFTGNREFKQNPRIITAAKGAYYTDDNGRQIIDGLSGLWTCGAGHCRAEISEAVSKQVASLDYSPGFQFAHPKSFELADKIVTGSSSSNHSSKSRRFTITI